MLHPNESDLDRLLRGLVAAILVPAGLLLLGGFSGSLLGLAVAVAGTLILATAVSGFCVLYRLFGVSTLKSDRVRTAGRGLI